MNGCAIPPAGWFCTRAAGHEGPCAAISVGTDMPSAIEHAFRAGFAAAEEVLGAHGSEHLLAAIEQAWAQYADDNALVSA